MNTAPINKKNLFKPMTKRPVHLPSTTALRVFAQVGRDLNMTAAARRVNLSQSAVSQQIRHLEEILGVALFLRSGRELCLTVAGARYLTYCERILAQLQTAQEDVASLGDSQRLTIRASLSLGTRWLIPALREYQVLNPDVRVSLETLISNDVKPSHSTDLAIIYRLPHEQHADEETLLIDKARPIIAPRLLEEVGYRSLDDIGRIPAIQCTKDNWDWKRWLLAHGLDANLLNYCHVFDTDDAALRASAAGFGLMLSSEVISAPDRQAGLLTFVPDTSAVEMGRYCLLRFEKKTDLVNSFIEWLCESACKIDRLGGL